MGKENLTLLSCSYNTPEITEAMIKSFVHFFGKDYPILIIENSTDERTVKILEENNIEYIRNPGGTHSPSVDIALDKCKTDYAILVDTDILFLDKSKDILQAIMKSDMTLAGTVCASRFGHNLFPRVHPWFLFIDVKKIKELGIKFHDENRIVATKSDSFYKNLPLAPIEPAICKYDVGATFYEDVVNAGLKVFDSPAIPKVYTHMECASWLKPVEREEGLYDKMYEHHMAIAKHFESVDIKFDSLTNTF